MPSPLPSTPEGIRAQREALKQRPDRSGAPATRLSPLSPKEKALAAAMRGLRTMNPQQR